VGGLVLFGAFLGWFFVFGGCCWGFLFGGFFGECLGWVGVGGGAFLEVCVEGVTLWYGGFVIGGWGFFGVFLVLGCGGFYVFFVEGFWCGCGVLGLSLAFLVGDVWVVWWGVC